MRNLQATITALPFFLLTACGSGEPPPRCQSAKCDGFELPEDQVPASPCDGTLIDRSGRGLGNSRIAGRLGDPFAKLVLQSGSDCPTELEGILEKLETRAAAPSAGAACDVEGRRTMFVSETAQLLGEPTAYRAITAIDCAGEIGIFLSIVGVTVQSHLPQDVEVMAFDPEEGIFNFYRTAPGGRLAFFGDSRDYVTRGPADASLAGDRGCAHCHRGGGPIMKELEPPWLHWEGVATTPGAGALIAAHGDLLGRRSDGVELKELVRAGIDRWNRTRLEHLRALGATQKLLRPLFCNVEVNLATASSEPQSGEVGRATFAPLAGPVIDSRLGFGALEFSAADYDATLRAHGQRIPGLPARFVETHFALPFLTPSAADENLVFQLKSAGIVDDELVEDILGVDFTRAVFSTDRCAMLEHVPPVPAAELSARAIRKGLIARLQDLDPPAETPARELLENLLDRDDDIRARVDAFARACEARLSETVEVSFEAQDGQERTREVPAVLVDYMKVISLGRERARRLPVFEFPPTMPDDDLELPASARLHPKDCTLASEFVSAREPARKRVGPRSGP